MKRKSENHGFAARQKTIDALSYLFKYYLSVIFIIPAFLFSSCNKIYTRTWDKRRDSAINASIDKPKINIKVNKRYEDNGNLMAFDSIYSSYYSNLSGDTLQMDSVMRSFDRYFKGYHAYFLQDQFNPFFFNDSLRYPDFVHGDFFLRHCELNDCYMRNMMLHMDSSNKGFYGKKSGRRKTC